MKLFIVLHHSDDPTQGPQFNKINRSHKNRGFPISSLGFYVGYQWLNGFNGQMKQARTEEERGAHCDAKLMNFLSIGVCSAGDFTTHKPNDAQIVSLEKLVWEIQCRWGIPNENILLHKECKATACPGTDLRALILKHRAGLGTFMRYSGDITPSVAATLGRAYARRLKRLAKR